MQQPDFCLKYITFCDHTKLTILSYMPIYGMAQLDKKFKAMKDNPQNNWHIEDLKAIAKSLHRKLSELSKQEGVSLNTLTVTLLAEGLGHRVA